MKTCCRNSLARRGLSCTPMVDRIQKHVKVGLHARPYSANIEWYGAARVLTKKEASL